MRIEGPGVSNQLPASYFLDTYAIIEYIRGNKAYLRYFSDIDMKTSVLNLMELFYHVLRDAGEKKAEATYMQFKQFIVPIIDDDVREGMKFKLRLNARRIDVSYSDAIGYAMAERLKAKFLTGDNSFRTLSNVEFVK